MIFGIIRDEPFLDDKGHPAGRGTVDFAPGEEVYILQAKSYDVWHTKRAVVAGKHRKNRVWVASWIDLRRLEHVREIDEPSVPDAVHAVEAERLGGRSISRPLMLNVADWERQFPPVDWEEENRKNAAKG